ncbi:putative P-loop containing nucleoside triphosphate hydrolase [Senna tora]|uniref:Putative P-loop containing nucleoside triphosphate hydrolase n=1 Tax=Senna tora TaxID=362788 RepID=A0A834X1L9_9FABA|nr:putative P-loop containing nucleoside triphosphate hydrolase [Senna tora]
MATEAFFWRGRRQAREEVERLSNLVVVSGPPSCGKTSLLFQFAFNVALAFADANVIFICNRHKLDSKPPFLSQGIEASSDVFRRIQMKYVNDDEDINKYFAAFHLFDKLPAAVVIDDFGDFFHHKMCQERYNSNPRGRDLAMVRSLALCHNAIAYANQKGSCKLVLSDTYHGDSPKLHFIYKKWIPTIFTIKGDESGSFVLKDKSNSGTNHSDSTKVAKYSIALQYLLLERIVEVEAQ